MKITVDLNSAHEYRTPTETHNDSQRLIDEFATVYNPIVLIREVQFNEKVQIKLSYYQLKTCANNTNSKSSMLCNLSFIIILHSTYQPSSCVASLLQRLQIGVATYLDFNGFLVRAAGPAAGGGGLIIEDDLDGIGGGPVEALRN